MVLFLELAGVWLVGSLFAWCLVRVGSRRRPAPFDDPPAAD